MTRTRVGGSNGVDVFTRSVTETLPGHDAVQVYLGGLLDYSGYYAEQYRYAAVGTTSGGIDSSDGWGNSFGALHRGRPLMNATWRGAMAGFTITDRATLVGNADVSFSSATNTVDIQLSGIGAVSGTSYTGSTSISWTSAIVGADGTFGKSSRDADARSRSRVRGAFYGPSALEAAGAFEHGDIFGSFAAKPLSLSSAAAITHAAATNHFMMQGSNDVRRTAATCSGASCVFARAPSVSCSSSDPSGHPNCVPGYSASSSANLLPGSYAEASALQAGSVTRTRVGGSNGVDVFHRDHETNRNLITNYIGGRLTYSGYYADSTNSLGTGGNAFSGGARSFGVLRGSRPGLTATWSGAASGFAADGGIRLVGTSTVAFSAASNSVDIRLSLTGQHYEGPSSMAWTNVSVGSNGAFAKSSDGNSVEGAFYGSNAEEAAGVFEWSYTWGVLEQASAAYGTFAAKQ